MAEAEQFVSTHFKQSIIGFRNLSFYSYVRLWLAAETEICTFGGGKSELPKGAF